MQLIFGEEITFPQVQEAEKRVEEVITLLRQKGGEFALLTPLLRERVRESLTAAITDGLDEYYFSRPIDESEPRFPIGTNNEYFFIPRWDGAVIVSPDEKAYYNLGDPFEFYLDVRSVRSSVKRPAYQLRSTSRGGSKISNKDSMAETMLISIGSGLTFRRGPLVTFMEQTLPSLGKVVAKLYAGYLCLYVEYSQSMGQRQRLENGGIDVPYTDTGDAMKVIRDRLGETLASLAVTE